MTRLSMDEAATWLRRFEAARVIPLALVLRRLDGTTYGNHFNGFRIRAHLYAEWAGSAKKRTRMRRKLLLGEAGMYVPPDWNPLHSSPPGRGETQDSDSTYIPSQSEPTETSPATAQATRPSALIAMSSAPERTLRRTRSRRRWVTRRAGLPSSLPAL
jgi:hypothetical protein